MTTSGNTKIGLRRLRKFVAKPLEWLCEGVVRRLRRFGPNPLLSLAKVGDAKVPHTPYELSQRSSALRSSFDQETSRATARARLPDRRPAQTSEIEHGGLRFAVTIGFYPDGRPGEVFTHGPKTGSTMDGLLDDACVAVSLLIQHGVEPHTLAQSMGRLGNELPASVIGAVVDLAAAARLDPH